ncbi:conserved hypothetical protein [Desulfosarcina cetonica]|nr:conserved hypothetical protein [Desulfosarcina cetonica]
MSSSNIESESVTPAHSVRFRRQFAGIGLHGFLGFDVIGRRQGRRAAVGRRKDDLAGKLLTQVADHINARGAGFTLFVGHHHAVGIHARAGRNQLVVGIETDKDEHAVHIQFAGVGGDGVLEGNPLHAVLAGMDRRHHGVPEHLNVAVVEKPLLKDLACPQLAAPVGDVNLLTELGQIECLLGGTVAAADDDHGLAPEKEAVAGGAIGNALAVKLPFAGNVEFPGAAAGSQNHGMGLEGIPVGQLHRMVVEPRIQHRHLLGDHIQVVGLGVLGKLHGKFGAADMDEAGIVLDFVAHGHLPAGDALFHQSRLQRRPHGVDGGGKAAGATADNDQIVKRIGTCHAQPPFFFRDRAFFSWSPRDPRVSLLPPEKACHP